MPSFQFLKSAKGEQQRGGNEPTEQEKGERRHSKREYFRNLLKRSSFSTHSKADKRKGLHFGKPEASPAPKTPTPPTSPMNKPLPPPPPAETQGAHAIKAPVQLRRIISPIALPELHKLFSGAPQFFCRSEGHHTGAPHPSVAFPWNLEVRLRDLRDHIRIQDEAWGCVTSWPHITAQVYTSPEKTKERKRVQRAHFLPRCRERPNMLSMQGVERGTMGFAAALEGSVGDALELPQEVRAEKVEEKRRGFLKGKDGLRPISDSVLVERLIAVGEVYQEDPLKHRKSTVQLYTELFTRLLFPPSRVIDSQDPYSLEVQIEALVKVLAAPVVWVDFSLVEWRIRLGQMLWGPADDEEAPGTQRYWLLLQVLLASELLVRLDAISMNIDHGLESPKPAEIRRFEKDATRGVKWSLHLARAWLDNIKVDKQAEEPHEEKEPAGWLATLTGTAEHTTPVANDLLSGIKFSGRAQERQLRGLVHFGRRMKWPNISVLESKATTNGIGISESNAATPLSVTSNRSSSYFPRKAPQFRRGLSHTAHIHPGGWLSNSYLSGLVLPGEGLSHFLMSTLLESDSEAVQRLGEQANLYGGFVYEGRSWWSTACVVGRVLAAGRGATECMGWVSTEITPRGAGEGWVDVDVESLPPLPKDQKPLIYHKTLIETRGHILGASDPSSILPGDFTLPADDFLPPPLAIKFEGLDLFAAVDSVTSTPLASPVSDVTKVSGATDESVRGIQTYSAMMRFIVAEKEISFSLAHDVHFVTAHPCVVDTCTADLIKETLKGPGSAAKEEQEGVVTGPGHPLHKAHTYTTLPLSDLLSTPLSVSLSSLLSSAPSGTPSTPLSPKMPTPDFLGSKTIVLIIDCTFASQRAVSKTAGIKRSQFGSDSEMIARAMCAERGWDAMVSRRGRTCLGCSVRECGALGGSVWDGAHKGRGSGRGKGGADGGGWVVLRVA